MKYYMSEAYQDIPQYAEVKYLGDGYDSGYSINYVEYNGIEYKPFSHQVKSEKFIERQLNDSLGIYNRWKDFSANTINKK